MTIEFRLKSGVFILSNSSGSSLTVDMPTKCSFKVCALSRGWICGCPFRMSGGGEIMFVL